MDHNSLDLNREISSFLFCKDNNSHNTLNYFDQSMLLESENYEIENEEQNFNTEFNKIFSYASPDKENNDDSFEDIDNVVNDGDIDIFITSFQKKLDKYYFSGKFDRIITIIEKRFPYIFNNVKNLYLLYLLQKLKFFKMIKENKIKEAKNFFKEILSNLIKEIKPYQYEQKIKFFEKIVKRTSLILKQGEIYKKYYNKFEYELEKSLRIFFNEENENITFYPNFKKNGFHYSNYPIYNSNSEIDLAENRKEINTNSKKENTANEEDELENMSTKEEYSDFEDEIMPKLCEEDKKLDAEKNENNNTNNCYNEIKDNAIQENTRNFNEIENPSFFDPVNNNNCATLNSVSKSNELLINRNELNENREEFVIDTTVKPVINECKEHKNSINSINCNSDYNIIDSTIDFSTKEKAKKKAKKNKNEELLFNQLPYLSSFKPKYVKRETIDKKIIRGFKNYLVKEYREKRFEINNTTMDSNFFINFINGSLLPPIDFFDVNTNENVKFNSFNCSYLLWFFSKKGVKDIYLNFINEKGKDFIDNISKYYEISQDEKDQLNHYINNYPFIFDISIINNVTQGETVHHLYRNVIKNKNYEKKRKQNRKVNIKKTKSEEDLNALRERSRSKEREDEE